MTLYRLCSRCGGKYENPGRSTGKCPACQTAYEREKSRRRRATSAAVRTRDSAAWQRARELARRRDGGCVLRDQGGCDGQLQVHHRVPLECGGTNELSNLRTLCRHHHQREEARILG